MKHNQPQWYYGWLFSDHPRASTYLVATQCLSYLHTYYVLTTYIPYLVFSPMIGTHLHITCTCTKIVTNLHITYVVTPWLFRVLKKRHKNLTMFLVLCVYLWLLFSFNHDVSFIVSKILLIIFTFKLVEMHNICLCVCP